MCQTGFKVFLTVFGCQGNKPLDLPTKEKREESWSKKSGHPMLVYVSADDVDQAKRQDAAIYWVSQILYARFTMHLKSTLKQYENCIQLCMQLNFEQF